MIRALIVDDSPTLRWLLRNILESDPELQVIGEARTGEEAVALCARTQPDVVTMDIHMPGMGGHEAIRRIMGESPCPIVVVTGLEEGLLDISFKALQLGALTVVSKPAGLPEDNPAARHLLTQVKLMASVKVVRRAWSTPLVAPTPGPGPSSPLPLPPLPSRQTPRPRLLAMGASTGGPPVLQTILIGLGADFPLPIVIVQHISQGFVGGLASWLDATTPLSCKVAAPYETLRPGTVYLAPDDHHLLIKPAGVVWLDNAPPLGSHRPAVTCLFESMARSYGAAAIGILLTGMGADGASGLKALRETGAYTIAQDETSSTVFGMPQAAVQLGAALEVLALTQIAKRLLNLLEKSV